MLLTEKKLRTVIREILLEKNFSQLNHYAKRKEMNVYTDLMDLENDDLRDEVYSLIDQSYAYIGGNADIRAPDHLADPSKNDYSTFLGWDIDEDPEVDVVRGMKPKAGKMKLTLSATDGTEVAANFVVGDTAGRLSDGQHYAEMSGRSATAQMKKGTPAITDPAAVQNLLPGKEIIWFGEHPALYVGRDPVLSDAATMFTDKFSHIEAGKSKQYGPYGEYDGWYVRSLGGTPHAKLIFGATG
jgi:hypothetical protein